MGLKFTRPRKLSRGDRRVLMVLCLYPFAYGLYVMFTGSLKGRAEQVPVEGPLAVGLGAIFAFLSAAAFVYAWKSGD